MMQQYGVYTRVTDYIPWIQNKTAVFLKSKENEKMCQGPDFWCNFKSGKDPTGSVLICILICFLILLLIVILTRRSNSYKVNAGAGKQGIVEENEFVYSRVGVPVVEQAANFSIESLSKQASSPVKRIQYSNPIVHQLSDILKDQMAQEEHFNTLDVKTFKSLNDIDSVR